MNDDHTSNNGSESEIPGPNVFEQVVAEAYANTVEDFSASFYDIARIVLHALATSDEFKRLLFESLGTASACWEYLDRAGIFESERCKKIGEDFLNALDPEAPR